MSRLAVFVSLMGLAFGACGGCDDEPDALPDITVSDMETGSDLPDMTSNDMAAGALIGSRALVPEQEGVSDDGAADITDVLDGEARSGRFTSAETGFYGLWSHCKQGDFKLYNGRVEACISNEISNRYETFAGGGLLDARVVGETGPDVFDLYNARIGWNVSHPDTVRVVRDGSDGGPAVIRTEGTDMPAAYFVGVAGHRLFSPLGLDVVVEYRLGPDDDFIEILTDVANNTDRPSMVQKGDLIAWGDRADVYREEVGFGEGGSKFSWIAAYGAGHSFAYVTPDDRVTSLSASFGSPPWEITQADTFVLQPGESFTHFGRFVIGDGRLDPVVRRARELLGEELPPQHTVAVVDAAGGPVAFRRVEVFDVNDLSIAGGTTSAMGEVLLSVPVGPHRFEVAGITGGGGLDETVTVGDDPIRLEVATTGYVELSATVGGTPSPASISISGPSGDYQGATWADRNRVELMPGEWTVTFAKGPEFDWSSQTVTVVAGETVTASAALTRVLDTTDWIAADFHQHMEPSSDSRVWVEDRVLDNAAQGVELLVPTDHDVVTDLVPIIAAAGLESEVTTFPGAEISPAIAHMNVYPLPYVVDAPGRGTIPLSVVEEGEPRRLTIPELIETVRAMPSDPVVQLNHPRDSSGLFEFVDFDPEAGPDSVSSNWWTTDFDAMELINGDDCLQFRDLSGLWNAGIEPTGIGSSDSHGLWGSVGQQRTYLHAPGTAVSALTPEMTRDIVKAGRVIIATSAILEFTDGIRPGDTVDGSSGVVNFALRIQSANWAGMDAIHVVVNGAIVEVIPVTPTSDTLDFEGVIPVSVTEDAWVVFFTSGAATGTYRPSGRLPFALNNPVRIDFDGGGFTAPGPRALNVDTLPLCN